MARFNEILVGRINRGLTKLTGIKGEAPAPQVASEIQPTFPLELGAEYRILEGWERFGVLFSVAAVAAQFGVAQLRCPAGVIGVIEKFAYVGQATTSLNALLTSGTSDFTTLLVGQPLDKRVPRPNSSLVASQQTQVGGQGANIWVGTNIASLQDMILTEHNEIVLAPGGIFAVSNTVVNLTLTAAIWWRERFLEESERTV